MEKQIKTSISPTRRGHFFSVTRSHNRYTVHHLAPQQLIGGCRDFFAAIRICSLLKNSLQQTSVGTSRGLW
jgi:hypothetical protein